MNLKKIARSAGVVVAAMLAGQSAMAAGTATVADLASSVSFADVGLAVLAVAGTLITLHVTIKGAKQVMAFVGK
jgi:hypothetical protein